MKIAHKNSVIVTEFYFYAIGMSGTPSPTAYGQGEHKTLQEDVGILPYGVLTKQVLNRTGTSEIAVSYGVMTKECIQIVGFGVYDGLLYTYTPHHRLSAEP